MKKKKVTILGAVLLSICCFGTVAALFRGAGSEKPGGQSPEPEQPPIEVKTLNEDCESASGAFTLKLSGEKELKVSPEEATTYLGGENSEDITITGGTINITGGEVSVIEAANAGTLTFKNVTIKDTTANDQRVLYCNYIRFGGKLRFENCTLDSIYLKNDAQAEFINCTFISSASQWYSAWVADGSAQFENCTFKGYRAIKINEFAKEDVLNVSINGCKFENISEKPGVVIGKFLVNPANSTVALTNNLFINCQQWDEAGRVEGLEGIYESDIPTSDIQFVQESNTVEYTGTVGYLTWSYYY